MSIEPSDARSWLRALGALVTTSMPLAEARERLDLFASLLAGEFDRRAFNAASLAFVARRCKFFPTFHEVCEALSAWCKEAKSLAPIAALTDDVTDLSPQDRTWLAHWHRREAEGFAPLREPDGRLSRPDVKDWHDHELSLLRRYAPRAAMRVDGVVRREVG